MFKLGLVGKKEEKRKHLLGPWSKKGDCLGGKKEMPSAARRVRTIEPDLLAAFIS